MTLDTLCIGNRLVALNSLTTLCEVLRETVQQARSEDRKTSRFEGISQQYVFPF